MLVGRFLRLEASESDAHGEVPQSVSTLGGGGGFKK